MRTPTTSVVVPARNAADTIEDCLVALRDQDPLPADELIVVDNGSSDDTAVIARRLGATVVRQPVPGAAAARNAGIAAATGELVCFTDADCRPTRSWLQSICRPLRSDRRIAGAKGTYRTDQRQVVARFVQLEYEDKYDRLRQQPTIDFIDTYSAAYRRDVLVGAGGFDERMTYLEDQELSFRLAAGGQDMVFEPDAVVYHLHAASLGEYLRKKWLIGYWKASVVRRFPKVLVRDSHTPQVMKLQMALVIGSAGALVVTAFDLRRGLAAFACGSAAFLATTAPFVHKVWAVDRAVALASPALLAARALALAAGAVTGAAIGRGASHTVAT